MKYIFGRDINLRKTVMRDAHAPETVIIRTDTNEEPCIEANKRIRSAKLMPQDSRSPFHEGDVIAFAFSFPTLTDYNRVKKAEPELFESVYSENYEERMKAAEKLQKLYPQYVVTTRRGDARRRE